MAKMSGIEPHTRTFDVNLVEGVVDRSDDPEYDLHTLVKLKLPTTPTVRAANINS